MWIILFLYKINICHLFNIHSEWLFFWVLFCHWLYLALGQLSLASAVALWTWWRQRHRLLKHRAYLLDRCHCVGDKCSQKGHGAVPILGPKQLCCTCCQYTWPRFPPSPLWQIGRPLWGPEGHASQSSQHGGACEITIVCPGKPHWCQSSHSLSLHPSVKAPLCQLCMYSVCIYLLVSETGSYYGVSQASLHPIVLFPSPGS